MKQADIVLYLFDVNEMSPGEVKAVSDEMQHQQLKFLLVGNKADMVDEEAIREKFSSCSGVIFISAQSQLHMEVLKERMVDLVLQDEVQSENAIVTNARHYHALQEVNSSLQDIMDGLNSRLPGDLLALDIRRSLQYLGEITGEVTNDDQLDYIFSKFCIGK
jgi:tRNA modification GTPase